MGGWGWWEPACTTEPLGPGPIGDCIVGPRSGPDCAAIRARLRGLALLYKVTRLHPQQSRRRGGFRGGFREDSGWEGVVLLGMSPELILYCLQTWCYEGDRANSMKAKELSFCPGRAIDLRGRASYARRREAEGCSERLETGSLERRLPFILPVFCQLDNVFWLVLFEYPGFRRGSTSYPRGYLE